MRFGSVCSGIEAASCAWHPLGWRAQFFSEIEPFPSAVLSHHYPDVPNLGDMTKFKDWPDAAIDLLVGGTPCQSFSVAGLRKGLDDPRGNLMLTYLAIAARFSPRWLVWENVPGVLSSNEGRDFGSLLGGLAELGYGFAYRILDAQYVRVESHSRAVPQRRRRVFVVGHLGDWRRAAAVLFERESMLGDSAPRRQAREGSSSSTARSVALRGREGGGIAELGDEVGLTLRASGGGGDKAHVLIPEIARALTTSNQRIDAETETETLLVANPLRAKHNLALRADMDTYVAHSLRGEGFDASEDGTGRGTPLVPVSDTLTSNWYKSNGASAGNNVGMINPIFHGPAVRRLTPRECLRLQGFADDYLDVLNRGKPAADGPKYKAIGNSMAIPPMHWIGRRIQLAEEFFSRAE